MEQVIGKFHKRDVYFWATHAGVELDLILTASGKRYGIEFKYAGAPSSNRSLHIAINDLGLEDLWVVYPGRNVYDIDEKISAISVESIPHLAVYQT